MKYALFPGCLMPTEQYAYEISIREIMPLLGVDLVDLDGFSCCGEPLKSVNQMLTLHLSARNLAIAEKSGLDLFVPCAMCHLALSECRHVLDSDEGMRGRINAKLAQEGLRYEGSMELVHTVDLLHDRIGLERLKEAVKRPLGDIKIATHYGCHIIRPSEIGRPVDSENPQKMERILEALGAKTPFYPERLDCCGAPLLPNHPDTALTKTGEKLTMIQKQGFDAMATVCPWCHKMYDSRQAKAGETVAQKLNLPVLYLTQLLGLALGLPGEKVGLMLNQSPVDNIQMDEDGSN